MGARPYWYLIPYEEDFNAALSKLRMREFKAGRYNPVIPFPEFPVSDESPAPGAQHADVSQPLMQTEGEGTRSILDLERVSEANDYCVARTLSDAELLKYFGTTKPSAEIIQMNSGFFNDIERGKGLCIVVFENEIPLDLFFVGYSFD